MAIYHLEAKIVSRGTGRSAVAALAYMSCSAILNDYDGIRHDYTRKGGLVWEQVFLPDCAPSEWKDRSVLWNAVEEAEKAKDSRLAREFVPALPVELSPDQWKDLLSDFIQNAFVAEGMCVDAGIHDPDPPGHNPHAHILLTVRPLNPDGTWQHKTEKEYLCVRNGEERGFTAAEFKTAQKEGWEKQYPYIVEKKKVYMAPSEAEANGYERASKNPKSTKYGRQNPISERWNSEGQLVLWREAWANAVNRALERIGSEERVDHRSHKDRGLDEQPTIHEGVTARVIEAKGGVSDRCELNRQIRRVKAVVQKLQAVVEATVPALAATMETVRRNLIEFHYGLRHIRDRRERAGDYVRKAETEYGEYLDLHGRIAEKRTERKMTRSELDSLNILNIGRRRELKSRVAELTEEIEELRTEERIRMQAFDKEDAAGMKEVRGEIDRVKADMGRLDEQETGLADSIRKEQENFTALKEQAEVLDRDELTEARLAMRKDSERQAWERIRESVSSGKVSFQTFRMSVEDTDKLLGESDADGGVVVKVREIWHESDGIDPERTYYGVSQNQAPGEYVALTRMNDAWYMYSNYTQAYNRYSGTVYYGDKSRFSEERKALKEMVGTLLANNDPSKPGQSDVVEIGIVRFSQEYITYTDTLITDKDQLYGYIDLPAGTEGNRTNWAGGLYNAEQLLDSILLNSSQAGEDNYVIFLTDGKPNHGINGSYGNDHEGAEAEAAVIAERIVQKGGKLYSIFTFKTASQTTDLLQELTNDAYNSGTAVDDYFFDAGNTEELVSAFENLISEITNTISVGNVTVSDGLTTDATATTLVNGSADGFVYSVTGPLGELYSVTAAGSDTNPTVTFTVNGQTVTGTKKTEHVTRNQVDTNGNPVPDPDNPGKYLTVTEDITYYSATVGGTEYKMALASIAANGQITWDLSAVGALLSGCTYKCNFVVWPDQEDYDYVAGLNNGLSGYEWDEDADVEVLDENGDVIYETQYTEDGEVTSQHLTRTTCAFCGAVNVHLDQSDPNYGQDVSIPGDCDYEETVVEPTCTEEGYTLHTCKKCGGTYKDEYTEPLGHEFDEGETILDIHSEIAFGELHGTCLLSKFRCIGAGILEHRCVRCRYHYLEPVLYMFGVICFSDVRMRSTS